MYPVARRGVFEKRHSRDPRWRHQMETFSALLALCAENSPVTGEFPSQRPVTRSFDAFFDLHLKITVDASVASNHGPRTILAPVRFLAGKAEWSARRNFTPVMFSGPFY